MTNGDAVVLADGGALARSEFAAVAGVDGLSRGETPGPITNDSDTELNGTERKQTKYTRSGEPPCFPSSGAVQFRIKWFKLSQGQYLRNDYLRGLGLGGGDEK
jgi:hypothetical protein